jgi:hypothetical protein
LGGACCNVDPATAEVGDGLSCSEPRAPHDHNSNSAEEPGGQQSTAQTWTPLQPCVSHAANHSRIMSQSFLAEPLHRTRASHTKFPLLYTNSLDENSAWKVGRWGEAFVLEYLKGEFADSLNTRIRWVNEESESGLPYDLCIEQSEGTGASAVWQTLCGSFIRTLPCPIARCEPPRTSTHWPLDTATNANNRYIEVKATTTIDKHLFEMSYAEWRFAQVGTTVSNQMAIPAVWPSDPRQPAVPH